VPFQVFTLCPRSLTKKLLVCILNVLVCLLFLIYEIIFNIFVKGVVLTKLSKEQADYIDVDVDGPYKPNHYRY
jgi:hypothetical protein